MKAPRTVTHTHDFTLRPGERAVIAGHFTGCELEVELRALGSAQATLALTPATGRYELMQRPGGFGPWARLVPGEDGLAVVNLGLAPLDGLQWISEGAQTDSVRLTAAERRGETLALKFEEKDVLFE